MRYSKYVLAIRCLVCHSPPFQDLSETSGFFLDMAQIHRKPDNKYAYRLPFMVDDEVVEWEPDQRLLTRRATEAANAIKIATPLTFETCAFARPHPRPFGHLRPAARALNRDPRAQAAVEGMELASAV